MNRAFWLSAVSVLALAACADAPGPQGSGIAPPSFWSRIIGSSGPSALAAPLAGGPQVQVQHDWWKRFNDPTLDALVTEALANNKTLAIAKARVEEARANRGAARARQLPQIGIAADASRGNQGQASNDKVLNVAEADLEASWEIDLFGQNRARTAEAQAMLESEDDARQGVMVGLLAELARTYFDLRDAERRIELTRRNLATQQQTFALIQAQKRGDMASDFDLQRAGARVSATAAILPTLETARDAALNRLAVLLGAVPGSKDALVAAPRDLAPLDPRILIAAPAAVLAARPDVRAAERRFAASISASEAATAELFPKISLTALFGVQNSTLFASATPWGIGAALVQPVLNFGRIRAQIDAADARQTQAFLTYQQTVLEALENMENALSAYLHEAGRNAALTTAVTQNRKATDLAGQQYAAGFTGLLDLLVAQRDLLDAESSQAASDYALRRNLAAIYAAAGGGWHTP